MTRPLYAVWPSPLGELVLQGDERALHALHLHGHRPRADRGLRAAVRFEAAIDQLEEYFAGTRTAFELCLQPGGSPFDQAVWRQVSQIPYGQTRSYAEVARAIGRTDRVRAVGSANARNPLPIIVPCHRVIGSDGSLTGYAGGLDRKRSLLTLEQGAWQQTLL